MTNKKYSKPTGFKYSVSIWKKNLGYNEVQNNVPFSLYFISFSVEKLFFPFRKHPYSTVLSSFHDICKKKKEKKIRNIGLCITFRCITIPPYLTQADSLLLFTQMYLLSQCNSQNRWKYVVNITTLVAYQGYWHLDTRFCFDEFA